MLIIGDLLIVIVGTLCELFWSFLLIVLVVKVGCYLVLVVLMFGLLG